MAVAKVGEQALAVSKENRAMVTSKQKIPTKRVLNEESYVADLGDIIQRDFFPDLPKLKVQKEYLEAKQRNDLVRMRELALDFVAAGRQRPDTATPGQRSEIATPSTFETPDPHHGSASPTNTASEGQILEDGTISDPGTSKEKETNLSLDKYLSRNTSEDNASFVEIMETAKQKVRQKHAWLYEAVEKQAEEDKLKLRLQGPETLAIEGPKDSNVKTWTYTPKNMLMYVPEGIEYSAAEKIAEVKKDREIKHSNTRFEGNPFAVDTHKNTMAQAVAQQVSKQQGKIGSDGKELVVAQGPSVNGYGFVATPSPAPGVHESPMMTWGEIESTPYRLDGNSTPSPGPQFTMPAVPKRDRLGLSLVEKASKQHRAKKGEALKRVAQNLSSPSPKRFGSVRSMERLQSLSPAAQKLVNKSMPRLNTDKSLRASYTPSPRGLPGDKTPILRTTPSRTPGNTPKMTPGETHASNTPNRTPSLTDNLLNFSKRSTRSKASDFF